ncbi:MAG TPA: YggT family protein [Alcaligenaceae bacterium]|nr:YggT family protein [Alcaligenaceae bacterium]
MLGDIFLILIEIGSSLIGATLIARAWIHAIRLHPFNPVSQAIYQATNWLIQPFRKVIHAGKFFDWASLIAAFLVAFVSVALRWMVAYSAILPASMLPATIGGAVITLSTWALDLVILLTIAQAILSWVNPMATIMPVLRVLTEPLLGPLRRILPTPGGIDLSPIALLILAQISMVIIKRIVFALIGV